jgi:hypothetical protein
MLLHLMEHFFESKKTFVLSNVFSKIIRGVDKRNEPLYFWTTTKQNELDIIDIDFHYRSASYNKKHRDAREREVIILPKRES